MPKKFREVGNEKEGTLREIFNNDKQILLNENLLKNKVFSLENYPDLVRSIAYPWNKIYKVSFIRNNNLYFSDTIVHNDLFFKISAEIAANKITIIDKPLYVHFINKISGQLTQRKNSDRVDSLVQALSDTDKFILSRHINDKILFNYLIFKFNLFSWAFRLVDSKDGSFSVLNTFFSKSISAINNKLLISLYYSPLVNEEAKLLIKKKNIINDAITIDNKKCILSVIVTTYNVKNYIKQSVESICNNNFLRSNYEIIIIDDCSTDGTQDTIIDLAKKYSNIKFNLIKDHTPGGVASAANMGINIAQGDYILYVDGDDFVNKRFLPDSLYAALGSGADITYFGYKFYSEKDKKLFDSPDKKLFDKLCHEQSKLSCYDLKSKILQLNPVPWRKIYKKSFLVKNNIYFPVSDNFFEDNPYHWICTIKAKSFYFISDALIAHRVDRVGQTMYGKGQKFLAFAYHAKYIKDFLINECLFDIYKYDFIRWILGQSMWIIPRLGFAKFKYIRALKKVLKDIDKRDMLTYRKKFPCKYSTFVYQLYLKKGKYFRGRFLKYVLIIYSFIYKKLKK